MCTDLGIAVGHVNSRGAVMTLNRGHGKRDPFDAESIPTCVNDTFKISLAVYLLLSYF